jgi:hypothetical protein
MDRLEDLPSWANAVMGDLLGAVSLLDERMNQHDQQIRACSRALDFEVYLLGDGRASLRDSRENVQVLHRAH